MRKSQLSTHHLSPSPGGKGNTIAGQEGFPNHEGNGNCGILNKNPLIVVGNPSGDAKIEAGFLLWSTHLPHDRIL